ncbi:sensor histidine kinase [Scopulibacillus cellulosilyticus]|uniref:histidine kinase n=1 Tax=Scopulibacillus cellulosilyticus TaxID=2665665 RepID=A0ABW2PZG3_9BACL
MIKIRTKLFIFSLALVLLLNGVAFYLYYSSQKSMAQYNNLLQRFFLLNEVSKNTIETYQNLQAYLNDQSPKLYEKYQDASRKLLKNQSRLTSVIENHNDVTLQNYRHMITSFLDECTMAIHAYNEGNINLYSEHLAEAEKISGFIKDATLDLIDNLLTEYRDFYRAMNQKNLYFKYMSISIFITTLLFCVLTTLLFSKSITRPIKRLELAAREIAKGNFDGQDVVVHTRDEFRFLTATFNHMKNNTQKLIKEMKQKSELDRLLKEMELKSLQSQMNPHFLFNTLNTVSKMAYLEDAEKTHHLITATASLLRYNLNSIDEPVQLHKEVKVIEDYFLILRTRFGDRLEFVTDIDKRCLDFLMPSMVLQPIVENAFIHGLEPYEKQGRIEVSIQFKKPHVCIEISDNGAGMDQETIKSILKKDNSSAKQSKKGHITGIGLNNVIRRLELFYQTSRLISISSEKGSGTRVSLTLPYTKSEVASHV